MPDDDGLPLPPPPQPQPAPIQRAQDIAPGTVSSTISGALQAENGSLGPYAGAVKASAAQSGAPQVPQFTPNPSGGVFQPTQSVFEQAVGSDDSTLGAFKAVGGSISSAARPIAGITDAIQVAQIRNMQQQFLNNQRDTFFDLNADKNNAQEAMRNMSNWMSKNWNNVMNTTAARNLMDQKAQVGNDVAADIANALDQTTDPDQRAQLQALQNDMQNWMQERDSRVGSEQTEVNALTDKINGLNSQIQTQIGSLNDAGRIPGPQNTYTNGALTGTDYADPSALNFMKGMQNLLVGSRGQISRVLGGS